MTSSILRTADNNSFNLQGKRQLSFLYNVSIFMYEE